MGINPSMIFKVKGAWEKFAQNHPKFPMFLSAAATSGIREGYIIEVKITDTEGKTICTNVKLTESDMELVDMLKDMGRG
jgi:hypothetical protein